MQVPNTGSEMIFYFFGGPTLQKESFFSKIKGHMNNVPPFQNAQKKLQRPKSKLEWSSHFQAKRRVTMKNPPFEMGAPPSLYSKN